MPYDSQAILERALAAREDMVKDYTGGLTALALTNRARGEHLADVASNQAFISKEAVDAAKRRIDEEAEKARLDLVHKAMLAGAKGLNDKSSTEQAINALQGSRTEQAETLGRFYMGRTKEAKQAVKDAADNLTNVANNEDGTPEMRRAALEETLASGAANVVPDKIRAKLREIITNKKDPAAAIKQVTEELQNRGVWAPLSALPGLRGHNTAFAEANNFWSTYEKALKEKVGPSKDLEVTTRRLVLQNSLQQLAEAQKTSEAHLGTYSGSMSPEFKKEFLNNLATPPANPADVLPQKPKPSAATQPASSGEFSIGLPSADGRRISFAPPMPGNAITQGGAEIPPVSSTDAAPFSQDYSAAKLTLARQGLSGNTPSGNVSMAAPMSVAQLRAAQDNIRSLPGYVRQQARQFAISSGIATADQIKSGDALIDTGDINDSRVQEAVTGAMRLLKISQSGSVAPPVQFPSTQTASPFDAVAGPAYP